MIADATDPGEGIEHELLGPFSVYDAHVDVVSAFEYMFCEAADLSQTVTHFERFPHIRIGDKVLTPDFTVLFNDATGIVGEVASIALHEGSVDKLCKQLMAYSCLDVLPGPNGACISVTALDVLYVTSSETGLGAIRRIIRERVEDPDHAYKPARKPCIVQYSRNDSKYTFQRISPQENGDLLRTGRSPNIVDYLDDDMKIQAARFAPIKVARGFINDSPPPLYLATDLWTRTWPSMYGRPDKPFKVAPATTAQALQKQYGYGNARDVKRALELLAKAGLAWRNRAGQWVVSRTLLGRKGDRDVHRLIVERIIEERSRRQIAPARSARNADQPPLF